MPYVALFNQEPTKDEIPERDVMCRHICVYLFITELRHTCQIHVLPEYFLNNAYLFLLHI